MMGMDKELLLKPRIPEGEVEIEGVGTVRVRGLSRDEVFAIQKFTDNVAKLERKMIALAMVEPVLTETEVGKWQMNSTSGEIEPVADKIRELSGLTEGADKRGVSETGTESRDGIRDVPSDEAGDDSGSSSDGDE